MKRLTLLPLLLALIDCSSAGHRGDSAEFAKPAPGAPKQITILFKGKPGESTETKYFSNAHTKVFNDSQVTNERQEIVDFSVATQVTAVNDKTITALVKTVRKDGTVDLHDLAFPELHEEIDFVLRPNGQILKAGKYSPQSIYFVPSLPVPDHPVEVGDTWALEHQWLSAKGQIPLKLDVVGILKGIVSCDGGKMCADVEVSGAVTLGLSPSQAGARFESRVWGRVLFSLDRGDVIWSEMRSHEEMAAAADKTVVSSCMVSAMQLRTARKFECDPLEQAVLGVPNL